MSRQLARETAAEQARSAAVAAYEMTPDRYAQIYTAARDWAQEQAELCGEGSLPGWRPSYVDATKRVGDMPQEAKLCVQLASDAWERLRTYWR